MGGCFSVSMSCDQVVTQVSQWLCLKGSYIHNLAEKLESLEKAMRTLKAKRDHVQGRVNREEFTGHHRMHPEVQEWLTSILEIENQFNDLLSTSKLELERLCLCGFCSKDLKLSYRYGKRVIKMLDDVESLISQGGFDVVTEAAPIDEVEELPIQPTIVGQETILERVWNRLMEDNVGIVGLYGMGGVGKTTLLMQINNKFSEICGRFDIVIWVVVSKYATIHKIQKDIGEKLGLAGKEWDEKDERQRSLDIHKVLTRKKFVLLLDDIWDKVDLKSIGVPYPNRKNGSKVAFTTRSQEVCGRMGVDDPVEVSCLDPNKAWDLFKKKVGENTLGSHPDIPELARKVAEKCRGLPLALNIIGETMACRNTVQEWHWAINVLTSTASEFSDVKDKILPILKFSYDGLDGEEVKSCFLYCSLFPEDYWIDKVKLIEYWMSEGFIDEKEGRERASYQGYGILGTLVRSCLLFEEEESFVRMHDVVRDMAIWIASDHGKEKCIVKADVGLREIPKVKNLKNVRRMSLMENEIEKISESLDCPELTTLFLQDNDKLATISGEFFRSMSKLLVLDLSENKSLGGLPEEMSELVSLRYLNLSSTAIKRLPVGLQELKMLIYLNLEWTKELESLHGMSKLSSLRTFGLQGSKVWLDMSLMTELQLLEHLELISITMSSSLVGELLNYSRVGRCIKQILIKEGQEESVKVMVLPALGNFRFICIISCGMREIKVEKTPWNKNLTSPCFSNLSEVSIIRCDGLKDLTWLLFAPNLIYLTVEDCKQMEDIISKEKAASNSVKETYNIIPFQKLESFCFSRLPELKSIYWNALPFQRLREFEIYDCPKLRKLPMDSKSVFKIEEFVIKYDEEEWIERVEWEDEATRHRFLPSFKWVGGEEEDEDEDEILSY